MTPVVSDEILTRESTAQDDGIFKHEGIFRIDPHAAFAAPDEDENAFPPSPTPLPPGERKKE